MAKEELGKNELVTGVCRLSYVNIMQARIIGDSKEPTFSLKILIPKTDVNTLSQLKLAVDQAKRNGQELGKKPFAKMSDAFIAQEIKLIMKDGDIAFPDNPECKGCWVLNAKTPADKPPGVLDAQGKRIINATDVYSGMYGRVHIQLFPFDTNGNKGIGCSLQNVQKVKDGDALGGSRRSAESVFDPIDTPFGESGDIKTSSADDWMG